MLIGTTHQLILIFFFLVEQICAGLERIWRHFLIRVVWFQQPNSPTLGPSRFVQVFGQSKNLQFWDLTQNCSQLIYSDFPCICQPVTSQYTWYFVSRRISQLAWKAVHSFSHLRMSQGVILLVRSGRNCLAVCWNFPSPRPNTK
ncbi:hypothetical protein C8R43DRAFT_266304 [Mycena crocata]|nr:hypothetical protein C8R43DRAFT_266304 [Mycena crocata]